MKATLFAGALAAAIAMPVCAQTPATTASPPPAPPPMSLPLQPGGAVEDEPWMQGDDGSAMADSPMIHHMMMHRMMMRANPQRRCIDRLAWRAARLAYVETELNLTAAQRPLWDKLHSIAQSEQEKERQLCDRLKPEGQLTMLERIDRAQRFLSARLDGLQAAKPAVQALYQSLTAEQKAIFDHPFRWD